MIKLAFVGDIMPGGVLVDQDSFCSKEVLDLLGSADIRIGTLECAIGPGEKDGFSFDEEKMSNPNWRNIIYSPEDCVQRIKQLNIDVVSLANNHIFDLGEQGLKNTIRILDKNGIKHVGANLDKESTEAPLIITCKNRQIAFLGYMPFWWEAPHPASEQMPGINLLHIEKVLEDIREYKKKCDYVFVLPHWGLEYTSWPTPREIEFVNQMINAGADGIMASHTHQVQPIVKFDSSFICYSLGNFLFPDFYMSPERPIFYPNSEEKMGTPIVYNYPKSTNQIVKRVWRKMNRIGQIAFVEFDSENTKKAYGIFTFLDKNNFMCCKKKYVIKIYLRIIGTLTKCKSYSFLYKVHYKLHHLVR